MIPISAIIIIALGVLFCAYLIIKMWANENKTNLVGMEENKMTIELSENVINAIADAVVKKMQEPKTERWIDIQYFKADDTYYRPKCPFCGIEPKEYSNYCPNCGAKLQEVEE